MCRTSIIKYNNVRILLKLLAEFQNNSLSLSTDGINYGLKYKCFNQYVFENKF